MCGGYSRTALTLFHVASLDRFADLLVQEGAARPAPDGDGPAVAEAPSIEAAKPFV